MKYNKLGTTDIEVSEICLGTMTFGEQNTLEDGHEQMDYALANGVNFFDTAEMYAVPGRKETQGETERIIGKWFSSRGTRDKVILATKVTGPSAGMTYIRNPLRFTADQIRTAIDGSLLRLQTDYVDLYQLHWPERVTNCFGKRGYKYVPNDAWEDNLAQIVTTMNELIKEGKIRHYGLSNETPWGVMRYFQEADKLGLARPVSIQNPYNLLNRTFEVGLAEICQRENFSCLPYSPMAFGLLSGKYHEKRDQPNDRINQFKVLSRYNSKNSWLATEAYLELAKAHNVSLAQLALAFVTTRSFVASNIIGATTLTQLKENIASVNLDLSESVLDKIEEIHELIPNPAP